MVIVRAHSGKLAALVKHGHNALLLIWRHLRDMCVMFYNVHSTTLEQITVHGKFSPHFINFIHIIEKIFILMLISRKVFYSWNEKILRKILNNIFTDRVIPAYLPDLTLVNKTNNKISLINVVVPWDLRTEQKEQEKKRDKYQNVGIELSRLWDKPVEMVPRIIGALGTIGYPST